jgi:FtsP/CotA-like multicopper oxidase with cupredoxin domain
MARNCTRGRCRTERTGISGPEQLTRRAFVAGLAGAGLLHGADRADVVLNIDRARIEVAKNRFVETTAYNGSAPGPLIRMREGVPVTVDIFNHTPRAEYVHWHGFNIPAALDGTEEEASLAVPANGHLRYRMTPRLAGSRYVHSHLMPMEDLSLGVYSGQFAFVYVEPKRNPGRYDQEVFLATHEWEPRFVDADDDEGAPADDEVLGETDWGPPFAEIEYGIRSINGKALGHGEPIRVREGQRVLFHLLNASATQNVQLYLPGHEFVVVALDGNPVPNPRPVGVLELGTAERVDAFVEMKNPGVWILGSADADVRGSGLGIIVEYAGKSGAATYVKPAGPRWDYRMFGRNRPAAGADETIRLSIDRVVADGKERWTINGRSFDPGDEPAGLHRERRYRLIFSNKTGDDHPLHLHRHTFELAEVNGKATSGIRKDVVVVRGFQTVGVDVTPGDPGLALFHCHQQMHMDMGFRKLFRVV